MRSLAVLSGLLIAVMVSMNGELSQKYPPFITILIINIIGTVFIAAILMIKKSDLRKFKSSIPFYFFLPGAFSVILTLFNNICITEIGVSVTLALALAGQSIFSTIVDSFGILSIKKTQFDKKKVIGFLLILSGIVFLAVF